jgi:hypothetical protein
MRIYLLLLLLLFNSPVFADSLCVGLLAKLNIHDEQQELSSETVLPYPKINVREVFDIFLRAVDLGQMQLFDKTLTRDMLQPLKVEYIYTLEDLYPTVNVYSELLKPISLPAVPDVYIIGVTGIMDVSGNIIESIAHCDIET